MRVIFNADDFGFSKALNYGVIEAHKNGVITSATTMANMGGFEHAIELAKENPQLGVGIHLVLTKGYPVTQGTTIVGENGRFMDPQTFVNKFENNEISLDEIEKEYVAQIEKFLSTGLYPSHLDSHHHMHILPGIFEVVLNLARKYDLPIRLYNKESLPQGYEDIKVVDRFYEDFYGDNISLDTILNILKDNKNETIEIMSHPAYVDEDLYTKSIYAMDRIREVTVLTNKELKDYIKDNNIELINYRQL